MIVIRKGWGGRSLLVVLGLGAVLAPMESRGAGVDGLVDWAWGRGECAIAPLYRKLGTNGVLLNDRRIDRLASSDSEPEETYTDGLTLRFCHQLTDFYVPQDSADLSLLIRRNYLAEAWWDGAESHPAAYPDRAFGGGWVSTLDARLAVTWRGGRAVAATVVDDEGTVHRFLLSGAEGDFSVASVPTSEHLQEAASISLTRAGAQMTLQRKYGRVLQFAKEPLVTLGQGDSRVVYYRVMEVDDPSGMPLAYEYDEGNQTLVPDRLVCRKQTIRIWRNAEGKVERISDPIGNLQRYEYAKISPEAGSALVATWYMGSGTEAKGASYSYRETKVAEKLGGEERAARVLELSSIADPNGNTYYLEYGGSRPDVLATAAEGFPEDRPVQRVVLPGNFGDSRYGYLSDAREGTVGVFVRDAAGNGTRLDFLQMERLAWPKDVWPQLRLAVFTGMDCTFLEQAVDSLAGSVPGMSRWGDKDFQTLETIRYRWNPLASYAPSEAIDADGNTTRFDYAAGVEKPGSLGFVPQDVVAVTNALGERRTFTYEPTSRQRIRTVDESGRVTRRDMEAAPSRLWLLQVFASEQDEKDNKPFSKTGYRYDDKRFPSFSTEKRVYKTKAGGPVWEADIVTAYEADESGRVWKETLDPGGLGIETERTHDASGDLVKVSDDEGSRRFLYDSRHHFLGVEWEDGHGGYDRTSEKLYDARGNKTAELGGDREAKFYGYDALNRVVAETTDRNDNERYDPDVDDTVTMLYDGIGNLLRKTDEKGLASVKRYDGLSRINYAYLRKEGIYRYYHGAGAGSILFEGDVTPATRIVNEKNWIQRKYDPLVRLVAQAESAGNWGGVIKRIEWDRAGNAIKEITSDGHVITRVYDAGDQLLEENDSKGSETRNFYTSTGLKYRTVVDGKTEDFVFDRAGLPVKPQNGSKGN